MLASSCRAGLLATAAVLAGAPLACSKTPVSALSDELTSDEQPICPASLDLALSASCGTEGASCSYLVPCVPIAGSASCVCAGGHYTCTTPPDGGAIDDGSAPCPTLATTELCPASEIKAQGLFCTESGLICDYPSACPSTPGFDTCQCTPARDDAEALHFECSPSCEELLDGSTGSLPEAGLPDGAFPDGGSTDAAPPGDGAAEL
jgi:hypothetical protein